jgi:hypothetical protein
MGVAYSARLAESRSPHAASLAELYSNPNLQISDGCQRLPSPQLATHQLLARPNHDGDGMVLARSPP